MPGIAAMTEVVFRLLHLHSVCSILLLKLRALRHSDTGLSTVDGQNSCSNIACTVARQPHERLGDLLGNTVSAKRVLYLVRFLHSWQLSACTESQCVRYPYIIREADIKAPLPAAYEDHQLFPDRPLPDQTNEPWSYAPNLIASVKWSRLTAEIWDTMFAANHPPIDPEFVASMDARIVYTVNHLLNFFRTPASATGDGLVEAAPFIRYQGIIQRLRHQQLRLLLLQEILLTLEYDDATSVECQQIIQNTLQMLQGPPDAGDAPVGRLAVVFYIVVTLLPLICLINGRRATQAEMLQQLAPSVSMARHVLSHMQDIITATKDVIQASHVSSTDRYPVYPYPSVFIPPDQIQTHGFGNIMDELLADPSLLDVVLLPSADPGGLWGGDAFSEQWMHIPEQ
ncbi:hypothetical protein BDV12DRAFT_204693 [Aspergillus spectabilis]